MSASTVTTIGVVTTDQRRVERVVLAAPPARSSAGSRTRAARRLPRPAPPCDRSSCCRRARPGSGPGNSHSAMCSSVGLDRGLLVVRRDDHRHRRPVAAGPRAIGSGERRRAAVRVAKCRISSGPSGATASSASSVAAGWRCVYLARQLDLDRLVALKELAAFHAASDPSFAQRFVRESRLAGSLVHPNVITVFDYFEHDGTPYIAMEYVERGSLRPYVGRMTLAQIGGVLEGLLAGLGAAEQHGDRASRPQAGEPDGQRERQREDRRLRDREGDAGGGHGRVPDRDRDDGGHAALHGARAGDGRARRSARGPTSTPSAACPTSCSPASRRSTTPTSRWRSSCGTSPSSSRRRPRSRAWTRTSRPGSSA